MASSTADLDQVSSADLQQHHWRAFTADTAPDAARAAYAARYGRPPAHITRTLGGIILAGPIPTASATLSDPARALGG